MDKVWVCQYRGTRANEIVLGEICLIFFQTNTFNVLWCSHRAYVCLKVIYIILFLIFKMKTDQPPVQLLLHQLNAH
jgi:succinate-acetate transporter protein